MIIFLYLPKTLGKPRITMTTGKITVHIRLCMNEEKPSFKKLYIYSEILYKLWTCARIFMFARSRDGLMDRLIETIFLSNSLC